MLVPNTSHAFSRIMSAALSGQGIRAVPLAIGREDAIRLGKLYVHNDICFPAQIVIGEALSALKSGKYDGQEVAIAMGKYIGDCRLTHYAPCFAKRWMTRVLPTYQSLPTMTWITTICTRDLRWNLLSSMRIAFALPMIDVLEELLRKIRPYELTEGSATRLLRRPWTRWFTACSTTASTERERDLRRPSPS